MADPRADYLRDHYAFAARQQAMLAQRKGLAALPAAAPYYQGGPMAAADTANAPAILAPGGGDLNAPQPGLMSTLQQSTQDFRDNATSNPMVAQSPMLQGGIMDLPGGVSPMASAPIPAAPPVQVHNVSDDTTDKSPASMPDTPSYIGDMINANAKPATKAPASQKDVASSPMLSPTQSTLQGVVDSSGIAALPNPVAGNIQGTTASLDATPPTDQINLMGAQDQAQIAKDSAYPTNLKDWTAGDYLGSVVAHGDPYAVARANQLKSQASLAAQPPVPGLQHAPAPPGHAISSDPAVTPTPGMTSGVAMPSPLVASNTPAVTADPNAQAIADIMQQKALINAIYPERPVDNSAQNAADAEADKDKSRTGSLAMLALMSGIAQGSGGIWKGVGQGLAGAGTAYEQGFSRYQKALQSKADRSRTSADQLYGDQTARADAAVKLYGQKQVLDKDNATLARQTFKDKQDDIDKYFTEQLRTMKGTDMNPPDQVAIGKTMRLWQISKAHGNIINSEDDLTK